MKRIIKRLATATVAVALLVGATGCVPEYQSTLDFDGSLPPRPECTSGGDCSMTELYDHIYIYNPGIGRPNLGNALLAGQLVTLLGDSDNQNNQTAVENSLSAIKGMGTPEEYMCARNAMLNWIVRANKTNGYFDDVVGAFEEGIPEVTGYILEHGGPPPLSKYDYGVKTQEMDIEVNPKIKELAVGQLEDFAGGTPSFQGAIDAYVEAWAVSGKKAKVIAKQGQAIDLSSHLMGCDLIM